VVSFAMKKKDKDIATTSFLLLHMFFVKTSSFATFVVAIL
jgi:hypothetical protein